MVTFVKIQVGGGVATAIDSDGEIWILCGHQTINYNCDLPKDRALTSSYYITRNFKRPIKTNWMLR